MYMCVSYQDILHTVWKCKNFSAIQIFHELTKLPLLRVETLNLPKLISRKIWMAEKFLNFHTVKSTLHMMKGLRITFIVILRNGLVERAQCGNYMIFLSLRFYVKSKLANLKSKICYFEKLQISEPLKL